MSAKYVKMIIYAVIGAAALVLFSLGLSWAIGGSASTEITEIISAGVTVNTTDDTVTEYIVGEEVNTDGVSITLTTKDGDVVTPDMSECEVEADLSSAGTKPVVVSWQDGTILYRGSYTVTVFGIRHISVEESADFRRFYRADETIDDMNAEKGDLNVWAQLTGTPASGRFTLPNPDWTDTVRLEADMFELSAPDLGTPGLHDAVVSAGGLTGSVQYGVEGVYVNTQGAVPYYSKGESLSESGIIISVTDGKWESETPTATYGESSGKFDWEVRLADGESTDTTGVKNVDVVVEGNVVGSYTVNVYETAWGASEPRSYFGGAEHPENASIRFYYTNMADTTAGAYKITFTDETGSVRTEWSTWSYSSADNAITLNAPSGSLYSTCVVRVSDGSSVWYDSNGGELGSYGSYNLDPGVSFRLYFPTSVNGCHIFGQVSYADMAPVLNGSAYTSLEISGDYKTAYEPGEAVDLEGIVVTAVSTFGIESRVLSDGEYVISQPTGGTPGLYSVTVSYGALSRTVLIAVRGLSVSFADDASGMPSDMCENGFDPESVFVTFLEDVDSIRPLSYAFGDYTVSGDDDMQPGSNELTVTYGEYTATITVYVPETVLTLTGESGSVTLYDAGSHGRESYFTMTVGDETVRGASYTFGAENGKYYLILYPVDGLGVKYLGTIADDGDLVLEADGNTFTAEKAVWESALAADMVRSISVSGGKTAFASGEEFSADGLTVTKIYGDGAEEEATEREYEIIAPDMTAGRHTVTVLLGDVYATYDVTVEGVAADLSTVKRVFALNESFSYEGLKVYEYTSAGERTEKTVTGVTASTAAEGIATATVNYDGGSLTYDIAVVPQATYGYVEFENRSNNGATLEAYISYRAADGNNVSSYGRWVYISSDGKIDMRGLAYTYATDNMTYWSSSFPTDNPETNWGEGFWRTDDTGTSPDNGYLFVTVNDTVFAANGKYWHEEIIGWSPEDRIELNLADVDCEYVVGEAFSSDGLVVTMFREDGTSEILNSAQYTVSAPDTSVIGVHTVTVEYTNQDIYATFTIEVIPDVDWDSSRMAATSGGSELALFVTYRGGNTAYGYWFVKSADGYEMFEFKAVGGVYSSPVGGFVITSDGDGITVTYDGETYTFGAADVTRVLGAAAQGGAA